MVGSIVFPEPLLFFGGCWGLGWGWGERARICVCMHGVLSWWEEDLLSGQQQVQKVKVGHLHPL